METKKKWSWKTTVAGIVTGLFLIIPQLLKLIGIDAEGVTPETLNVGAIGLGLGAMGIGLFARDNNKSSESVGADK